jgi:hypothetical protein
MTPQSDAHVTDSLLRGALDLHSRPIFLRRIDMTTTTPRFQQRSVAFGPTRNSSRRGLSLIDVLVLIGIFAISIALIAPAVRSPREASRKLQCLNNMKQLALAMHNFAAGNNGALPYLSDAHRFAWTVPLLPMLDESELAAKFPADNVSAANQVLVATYGGLQKKVFVCPNDPNNLGRNGGLSYVVNAGYGAFLVGANGVVTEVSGGAYPASLGGHNCDLVNWRTGGDPDSPMYTSGAYDSNDWQVARRTGVFWRPAPDGFRMTLDRVSSGDGLTNTLMISESANAGSDGNWASSNLMNMAFVYGATTMAGSAPNIGNLSEGGELTIPAGVKAQIRSFKINFNKGSAPGVTPSPSSLHSDSVNAFFCDGSGRSISERIDVSVYLRIMTPEGTLSGQAEVGDNAY